MLVESLAVVADWLALVAVLKNETVLDLMVLAVARMTSMSAW